MRPSEIELNPSKHEVKPKDSPKSITDETITTASVTPASSPESDNSETIMIENPIHQSRATNLLEAFNEVALPQTHSIADRIRPTFEIHLSPEEEITHSIVHDINWSFITPIGLQQYDYELKKITVVLSVEELQNLGLGHLVEEAKLMRLDEEAHTTYDELVEAKKKTNINERLSIEQWRNLEIALIKSPYGRTVMGYSINEEVYLKFWGHVFQLYYQPLKYLGYSSRDYQYPPRNDDTEKLMLDFFQRKIIKDISLAIQIASYSYLSIEYIILVISLMHNSSLKGIDILLKYVDYFAITSASVFLCTFLFLNLPCIDETFKQNTASKFFFILEEYVNNSCRLYNYLNFYNWTTPQNLSQIFLYSIIPILFISIYIGLNKKDKTTKNRYYNISKYTCSKFIYNLLNWTSYNQSLLILSSTNLVNLSIYYKNDDDKTEKEYYEIYNNLFYGLFFLCFIPQIMRHPLNIEPLKYLSKYLSNLINGMAYSLFDNFAFMEIYALFSFSIFKKNTTTPKDYIDNSFYFIFLSLSYIYSLHARYVNTSNIPEYSTKKLPANQNTCNDLKLASIFKIYKNDNNHENLEKITNKG